MRHALLLLLAALASMGAHVGEYRRAYDTNFRGSYERSFERGQIAVLHVFVDDIGNVTLEAARAAAADPTNYPDLPAGTPTIDSLLSNGVRFIDAYTVSSCAPSRSNIMLGYEPFYTNVLLGSGEVPLDSFAVFNKYLPGRFSSLMEGKMGYDNDEDPGDLQIHAKHGLDTFVGLLNHRANDWWANFPSEGVGFDELGTFTRNPSDGYYEDLLVADAEEWLDANALTDRPFVVYYWSHESHNNASDHHSPPPRGSPSNKTCQDGSDLACAIKRLQYHDLKLGELLDKIRERDPNLERTLVIWQADNGDGWQTNDATNCGNDVSKGRMCEAGIKGQNMIVAYGDVSASLRGTTDDTPVTLSDVMPTILDYAGGISRFAIPQESSSGTRHGVSLRPLWTEPDVCNGHPCWEDRECIFVSGNHGGTTAGVASAGSYRKAVCTTAATDGFTYWVNFAGTQEYIFTVGNEEAECVGAACDAAKAAYRTLIQAHDGGPLP